MLFGGPGKQTAQLLVSCNPVGMLPWLPKISYHGYQESVTMVTIFTKDQLPWSLPLYKLYAEKRDLFMYGTLV